MGRADIDEQDIVRAARAAHAWSSSKLPDGLATRIGQNGSQLSGGQRQRIAIARAFLKNAPSCCSTKPPRRSTTSPSAQSRMRSTSCARTAPCW